MDSRRNFLGKVATGLASGVSVLGANDRVRVGIIGAGARGMEIVHAAMAAPNVEMTAFADIYTARLEAGKTLVPTAKTYLDYLKRQIKKSKEKFVLSEEQRSEIDREFVQYYHRRICWLHLHEFDRAVEDADHTLQLMDLSQDHSSDEEWTISHEQYRPFVLYHRTQAAALALVESGSENFGERAIDEINQGLERIRQLFVKYEAEEQFQEDELVQQLVALRDNLRQRFDLQNTLRERLAQAIASEDYEQAARLRDQLHNQLSE